MLSPSGWSSESQKSHQTKGRQREKLQLHSYLPNLGIFFLKKELRRGWREARGRIIRMRDSKFGLCYKKSSCRTSTPRVYISCPLPSSISAASGLGGASPSALLKSPSGLAFAHPCLPAGRILVCTQQPFALI